MWAWGGITAESESEAEAEAGDRAQRITRIEGIHLATTH